MLLSHRLIQAHASHPLPSLPILLSRGLREPNPQQKRQPKNGEKRVRAPGADVVARPVRRPQAALALERKVHAAQARKVGEQQGELEGAPDGEVGRQARQGGREDAHGEGEAAGLVEEEGLAGVVGGPGGDGADGRLGGREVEVHAVEGDQGVEVGEEEGVGEGHVAGGRGHDGWGLWLLHNGRGFIDIFGVCIVCVLCVYFVELLHE